MSEPNSASDPTPEVPKAPSFTYGNPAATPAPAGEQLPPPQYGERLPAPAGPPAPVGPPAPGAPPAYGVPTPPAPAKGRRTWDLVLTIVLLVVGFLGMIGGVLFGVAFGDPAFADQLEQAVSQQGITGEIDFSGFGPVVILTHVLLYLVAVGVSILLLVLNKVAFWVPLTAGVIAAIVLWGGYYIIVFSSVDISQFGR
jgi:hypothetical protein